MCFLVTTRGFNETADTTIGATYIYVNIFWFVFLLNLVNYFFNFNAVKGPLIFNLEFMGDLLSAIDDVITPET